MYINWSLNSGYISKFPYSNITTTHGITVGNIAHCKIIWTSQNQGTINIILDITNLNNFKDIYEKMYIYLCFNINTLYILHTYLHNCIFCNISSNVTIR